MTEDELSAIVEAKLADRLAARLQADRDRVRAEVITEIRREAERAHYDRINSRHPIEDKYGGLGPDGQAARLAAMSAGVKRDMEKMDRANQRPIEGSLVHQRSRAALVPGAEGFEIRPGRRS
jgi:hypothetical protein